MTERLLGLFHFGGRMQKAHIEKSKPKFTERSGDELKKVLGKEHTKTRPEKEQTEDEKFIDQMKGKK